MRMRISYSSYCSRSSPRREDSLTDSGTDTAEQQASTLPRR